MARGNRQRTKGPDKGDPGDGDGGKPKLGPPPKLDGTSGGWFEEAWHGWLKPVGGILVAILGYLAYDAHLLPEEAAGRVLLALIIGGAIYMGIDPALGRFSDPRKRYLLLGASALWAVVAVAPIFRTVFPGKVVGETTIGATKDSTSGALTIADGDQGPYAVTVSGHLKGSGEVDASYEVEVTGAGGSTARIAGDLKRTYFSQRVSRRGTGSIAVKQENTENLHRLANVTGPELKFSGEVGSEMLDDGLHLTFRRAGPSPIVFLGLGLLLVIAGIVFDYRMVAPKAERTHLAAATGFTLAFGAYYPEAATPHNLVRPAVAALLVGAGLGALVAWVISAIANSFKRRPKKLAGVKNRFADEEE